MTIYTRNITAAIVLLISGLRGIGDITSPQPWEWVTRHKWKQERWTIPVNSGLNLMNC